MLTTDESALRATARANPTDPTVRLVLADCLDEQGKAREAAPARRLTQVPP